MGRKNNRRKQDRGSGKQKAYYPSPVVPEPLELGATIVKANRQKKKKKVKYSKSSEIYSIADQIFGTSRYWCVGENKLDDIHN